MSKFFRFCLLIFGACLCLNTAEAKLFGAHSFSLDNGLEVVVVENHKAPIIKYMMWYKAGAVDEPTGKGGLAHLLEHLMFRGTDKVSGEEFDTLLKKNGVVSNAFTSLDFTAYHHKLDISKLELVMALEADRMQNLNITDENFALEQQIVFQERKQMVENNPSSEFYESYRNLIWQEHPYHRPVSGTEEEIKSLTKADALEFYHNFYTPSNAVLVLSGDIDVPTAQKLAQKYYGHIKSHKVSKSAVFPELKNDKKSELKMSLPLIKSPRLIKTYLAPSYNTDKSKIYDLAVFSKYLGEGETSALYKDLVLDKKLALGVSSSYDFVNRDYGSFVISAIPASNVSAQELSAAIDEAVLSAINNMSLDKVNQTKEKMLSGLVYLLDNPFNAAESVGMMSAIGMSVSDIENHAENIRRASYKSIKANAKDLILNAPQTDGILLPKGEK